MPDAPAKDSPAPAAADAPAPAPKEEPTPAAPKASKAAQTSTDFTDEQVVAHLITGVPLA
jgi:hypothetical protein